MNPFDVVVNFTAGAVGLESAFLRILSNDADHTPRRHPAARRRRRGHRRCAEPSLAGICAYQIPTIVGDGDNDSGEATTDYPQSPHSSSQELPMQRLVKAGPGPVTVEVLAAEAINTDPAVRFGYYKPGNRAADAKTELFTIGAADAQSLQATPHGVTSFDPGSSSFGLYSTYPGVPEPDQGRRAAARGVQRGRALNLWDGVAANRHKVRFFPLATSGARSCPTPTSPRSRSSTPRSTPTTSSVIVRNVKPAASGPEIGLENLDGTSFTDRLTFSRIQNPDNTAAGKPNNLFHDTAKLRPETPAPPHWC